MGKMDRNLHPKTWDENPCWSPAAPLLYNINSLCRVSLHFSPSVSTPQEPIYRPSDETLDISVNKTKEDLSRPPFSSVYQREVLKRQLTFSLAFPICSILLLASLPVSFLCLLLPFPPYSSLPPFFFFFSSWPLPLHPPTSLLEPLLFFLFFSHLSSLFLQTHVEMLRRSFFFCFHPWRD